MSLTEQEIIRYSRHIILPEVGGRGQKKLKGGSVLLAGVGPAGSAAALYLAAAGVGQITLWDPSVVTPNDMVGAIAHDWSRVGLPKARSAAIPLRAINPDARIEVLDRESDVIGQIAAHQILLAAAGNWPDMHRQSRQAGVRAIFYGSHGGLGAVATLLPDGPCLGCLREQEAVTAGLYPEDSLAVAATGGVVGVIAATEAVKLILGIGKPLSGRVLSYDGWGASFREIGYDRRPDCPVCGGQPK